MLTTATRSHLWRSALAGSCHAPMPPHTHAPSRLAHARWQIQNTSADGQLGAQRDSRSQTHCTIHPLLPRFDYHIVATVLWPFLKLAMAFLPPLHVPPNA